MVYDKYGSSPVLPLLVAGFSAAILLSVVESSTVPSTVLSHLRLSERKASVLSVEERADVFVKDVVPAFGLHRDSFEYKVLHRACIDGVYGSQKADWGVSQREAEYTFDTCGWKVTVEKK